MTKKRILIVDNYDSFVYNLVQLVREAKGSYLFDVVFASQLKTVDWTTYDALLISPGPGLPTDEPLLMEVLLFFVDSCKPILGICLGCQAIAIAFGYELRQLPNPLHGHMSRLQQREEDPLFQGVEQGCAIARYHSWVVDLSSPLGNGCLQEIGYSEDCDGHQTMALRHRTQPIWGLQFHPESMISSGGKYYIENWLAVVMLG